MTHIIKYISLFVSLVLLPSVVTAQKPLDDKEKPTESKTSVIKVNKLDMVYPDDDFAGVVVSTKEETVEDSSTLYNRQYLTPPPAPLDTAAALPNLYQSLEDEGAESEDEILYASFDPNTIHYPKIDLSKWNAKDTVHLRLVNPARGENFVFPTPSNAVVSSHFGARRRRFHYGLDLSLATGRPIYSAFDGVVRVSVYNKSYGNLLVVRHHNGLETYYAHLSKRIARVGDTVKAGDTIGLCGNTGRSYGSHLHFEIRYMGAALNPEHVIDATKRELVSNMLHLTPKSFARVGSASTGKASSPTYTSGGVTYHRVRSGDTLGHIAKRYGTTVRRLCQLNGIKETTILQIGRKLRVR